MRSQHFVKYILLCCVFLVAYLLRFAALDASSLWSDEGNTWALMSRSVGQIARDAAADIHPPGYYWLLRGWTAFAGTSAYALRAASALVGVATVLVTYAIARLLVTSCVRPAAPDSSVEPVPAEPYALVVAFFAAVNAFQIYYSQEARMYMLLTLESALLAWALLALLRAERFDALSSQSHQRLWLPLLAYGLSAIAGLWTHYSFPIVLAAMGVIYLIDWGRRLRKAGENPAVPVGAQPLLRFIAIHIIVLLAFAPWLPTAIHQVLNWPQGGLTTSAADGIQLTLHMLTVGPLRNVSQPGEAWYLMAGVLPLLGAAALIYRTRAQNGNLSMALVPIVWLLAPVGLMFGLGLFSDSFLKFLLVASPAWSLLIAAVPWLFGGRIWRTVALTLLLAGAFFIAVLILPGYYTDPLARDNYAGVARYIRAQPGELQPGLMVLNAPGQQEVWSYYERLDGLDIPALALPANRPPDPTQTVNALEAASADSARIAALFWATDEADPDRIVETWLDQNAFKTLESWQGNVRFVWYQRPDSLTCSPFGTPPLFTTETGTDEPGVNESGAAEIQLLALCQEQRPPQVEPGQAVIMGIRWRATEALEQNYKVTIQLLDARSQVVAQRDSVPAGGSMPTSTWSPGETVVDNHGILVPFGTPPGTYRMITALYDEETGERLLLNPEAHPTDNSTAESNQTFFDAGTVQVQPPMRPLPADVVPMNFRRNAQMGPVNLVGYDMYKSGFAHAPETALQAGDLLHITFYWQAPTPLPDEWPADLHFSLQLGDQQVTAPLAGGAYATAHWSAGALVRGEFDIVFDGTARRPLVQIGDEAYRLAPVPQ